MCSVAKNPLGAIRMVEECLKRRNKVIIISIRADIKALLMCLLTNTIVKMFAFFHLQFNETFLNVIDYNFSGFVLN